MYVWAGEYEVLQGAAAKLVHRARAAGVPVVYSEQPHAVHMIHLFSDVLPEARVALQELASMSRILLAGGLRRGVEL